MLVFGLIIIVYLKLQGLVIVGVKCQMEKGNFGVKSKGSDEDWLAGYKRYAI